MTTMSQPRSTLVVGMGRSGLAAIAHLRRNGAARVIATDSRPAEQLPEAVRACLAQLGAAFVPQDEAVLEHGMEVVLSPGVPTDVPLVTAARARGLSVIGEVELAARALQGPCIGITGANGKTTTTSLVGHILAHTGIPCQVGGNIGVPPTAMVETSRPGQWNVLELSSFQLETIRDFRADIGACLNVTPDHLDRHHTFENYAAAKRRLIETQQMQDTAVLNADDPTTAAFASHTRAQVLWFSATRARSPGVWLERDRLVMDGKAIMLASEVPLVGRHNLENAMAAAAMARVAGASLPRIAAAIRTFPGVEHRLEFTRTVSGVRYYNDSKATNVDATLKALDAFPGNLWIILGGKDKGSDYRPLRESLAAKARAALLIGAAAGKIAAEVDGAAPLVAAGTLAEAIRHAHAHAQAGDVVLLAPACASFDQFDNFEHRGRVFKELVAALPGQAA